MLVGDIEKAVLVIGVAEEDHDALRFLRLDDPFREHPKIIVLRFFPCSIWPILQPVSLECYTQISHFEV